MSNEYIVVCLAVDTLRLGSQEGVDTVLERVRDDNIVDYGFAENLCSVLVWRDLY